MHRAYEFNLRRYFPDERFKLIFSLEQFDPRKMLLEARAQFFLHAHTGPRETGPLHGGPSSKGYCLKIRCACCASLNLTHVRCERRYAKDERDSINAYSSNFMSIIIWNLDSLAFIYPEIFDSVVFLMKRILVFQHEEINK